MRLLAATLTAFLALVATALGSGGPVIPGGAWDGDGPTGPGNKTGSVFRYVTAGADPTLVERVSIPDARVGRLRWLDGTWALPAVTVLGEAGGLSADGRTLVLVDPAYNRRTRQTRMLVLETERFQTTDRLTLDGTFSFDAISPDGKLLYLVQYRDPRDPLDYRVRQYDLAADQLRGGAIVDPDRPGEKMTGQPVARKASPDGRWAYTLYGGGEETFVHALDTELGQAQCIDLERFGPRELYRLGLEIDRSTGELTVLRKGDPAATVDPQSFEVTAVVAPAPSEADGDGSANADWVGPVAIGAGVALLAAACLLVLRRYRRATA